MTDIQLAIGDQKIDIVVSSDVSGDERPVVIRAMEEGVCL